MHPDVLFSRELRDLGQLVFADQRAGRIRRRVDDDALRARRHRVQEQIGRQREAVLGVRVDDHRRRVRQLDLLGNRRPARRVRDHFIARAEQRENGVGERLLAARGDDHLILGVVDAIVGAIARDDRLLQLGGPGIGRVLR